MLLFWYSVEFSDSDVYQSREQLNPQLLAFYRKALLLEFWNGCGFDNMDIVMLIR